MSVDFNTSAMRDKLEEIASRRLQEAAEKYRAAFQQLMAYERNVHNTEVLSWSKHKNINGQVLSDQVLPKITVEGAGLEFDVKITPPDLSGLNEFQQRGYLMCFENVQAKMKERKFGGDA